MDNFQALSANRLLFDLASRLGSLEGYLYAEEKVDKSYLPNWIDNIDHEFKGLSPEVRSEIQSDYLALLKKVGDLLHKAYGDQDPNTAKIAALISRIPQ
ncbi:MAG TPA: hypothetical protein VFW91_13090 [Candidatus Binatia bacterium]|jgi:hypothetical protein|nr:hypothetical protein [Candidatus Binatia bacterium]